MKRTLAARFLRLSACPLAFALFLSIAVAALPPDSPAVSKVEPPNWWIGYISPVMILLYGQNLNGAEITTGYRGVSIAKIETEPDGKHAFLWLNIASDARPGTVDFSIKSPGGATHAALTLLERPSPAGKYQGLTRDDVIYLIMPDRFADGDPGNNQPPGSAAGTYDRSAAKSYHGGDLKGVQQHLPYLKDLGVTTLWITPLYANSNAASDYHGYHAVDEYSVEDRFGNMDDFRQLVNAAHSVGMKVLLDMVPNHVGPRHPWASSQPAPNWLHGTLDHHLNTDYYYTPVTDPHAVRANYISALDGWFADALPDLAQENPLVSEYLLDNAYWWTESSGIDGFRIDTFPYVPRTFWAYYHKGLFGEYPHFFTVGEIFDFNPTVTSYWAGGQAGFDGIDTGLTTPFDFPMNSALREVINHGASAKKIVDVLRQDRLYPHPELLVTFIGNHDMKRFLTDAGGSREKLKLAFSILATLRGIPQLYYGDEIGMAGGEDPDCRHDFPGGFPGDRHNAFTPAGRTAEEQDIFAYVQHLLRLRREHAALRTGSQKHVSVGDRYYAFTREESGEQLLVIFHSGNTVETLTLNLADTSISGAKELLPILGSTRAEVQKQQVQLQLPPVSLMIYRVQ